MFILHIYTFTDEFHHVLVPVDFVSSAEKEVQVIVCTKSEIISSKTFCAKVGVITETMSRGVTRYTCACKLKKHDVLIFMSWCQED